MEISEEAYNNFSWKTPPWFLDPKSPILNPEPIIDLKAEAFESMQRQSFEKRRKFDEVYLKIRDRYDFENKWHKYYAPNYRENYTPKQKRRIRKQTNKWRKRILGEI